MKLLEQLNEEIISLTKLQDVAKKKDFKKAIGLTMCDRQDINKNIVSKLLQKKLV